MFGRQEGRWRAELFRICIVLEDALDVLTAFERCFDWARDGRSPPDDDGDARTLHRRLVELSSLADDLYDQWVELPHPPWPNGVEAADQWQLAEACLAFLRSALTNFYRSRLVFLFGTDPAVRAVAAQSLARRVTMESWYATCVDWLLRGADGAWPQGTAILQGILSVREATLNLCRLDEVLDGEAIRLGEALGLPTTLGSRESSLTPRRVE